jgi:eukaryotic-like serine/threonine-protein kinase
LSTRFKAGLRFDEAGARRLFLGLPDILEYLHGLSPPVLHRDIKPANIMNRNIQHPAYAYRTQ